MAGAHPALSDFAPAEGELVSVIIPARNEAATIDNLLGSLLRSSYRDFEVLVVNDRSTDDTAQRVRRWQQQDSRITLIEGRELPDGWYGKPWACVQGAEQARGSIFLFTDADTTHTPALLGHTVGVLKSGEVDLLSLTSRVECGSFWERLVMPQIFAILGVRFSPARVSRSRNPLAVAANGQFIAMPRNSYRNLAGHEAVKDQVVEDIALAQHCVRSGGQLRFYHGEDLMSTRMYRSLGEMIEGWSKNIHSGSRLATPPGILRFLAPFGVAFGMLFWLLPFIALLLGIATQAALLAIGASLIFWAIVMIGMQIPWYYATGYPLGAAVGLFIVLRSIVRGRRLIVWRGRAYRDTTA